jgi:hypothetical protein
MLQLRQELHEIIHESILGKLILGVLLLAGAVMLYFPVKSLILDPTQTDMVIYIAILGLVVVWFIALAVLGCFPPHKPTTPPIEVPTRMPTLPPSATAPSVTAPSIQEDTEGNFTSENPLRSTPQTPASQSKSSVRFHTDTLPSTNQES